MLFIHAVFSHKLTIKIFLPRLELSKNKMKHYIFLQRLGLSKIKSNINVISLEFRVAGVVNSFETEQL